MTSYGMRDDVASYSSFGVQVGTRWWVRTVIPPGRPPILTIDAGGTYLAVHPAGDKVSADHLEFAHALVAAAGEYLIECDRQVLEAADRANDDDAEPLAA